MIFQWNSYWLKSLYLLPGQMFILHRTEWNALQGLLRHLVGLHVDPVGH